MKSRLILFLIFLCFLPFAIYSQKTLPLFKAKTISKSHYELKNKFTSFTAINLETEKLVQYVKGKQLSSFRLQVKDGLIFDLDIQPSHITSSDYKLKVQTENGLATLPSNGDFLYKGKTKEGGEVRLAIKEGFIYGSIQNQGKEYFIEPLSRFITANKDEFIIYEAKDVIQKETFSCGVNDKADLIKREEEKEKTLREQTTLSIICKKIKIISVADYSMYLKFGSDVRAVETALLANLNLVEGAFAALNLGPDGSTDAGTDILQFEMEEIVVSTCKECNVTGNEETPFKIFLRFAPWIRDNYSSSGGKVFHFWSTKQLIDEAGRQLGGTAVVRLNCNNAGSAILRYFSDDIPTMRMLIAHETGHVFGCIHDDQIKKDVTSFIMYSASGPANTRFSTLADFGGIQNSSQLAIRNKILENTDCLKDCGISVCDEVKDLKLTYFNSTDSIKLNWSGSGNFIAKYKIHDSINFDAANTKEINTNSITLKNLNPCTIYRFEIQKACSSSEYGRSSSLIFNTSSLNITQNPINNRGDKYDLQINLNCKNCSTKEYFLKLDGKIQSIPNNGSLQQLIVRDLFADGARHRIDLSKDSGNRACTTVGYYLAPYYRADSKNIYSADFNSCNMPTGWKDSLLAKSSITALDARWFVAEKNFLSTFTPRGNLDSTCMLYYNTLDGSHGGAISLTGPSVDLSKYQNVKLHFDYNFLAWTNSNPSFSSIGIEIFDGTSWVNVFKRNADETYPVNSPLRNLWDSIPHRGFLDLERFKNIDARLRIIADDGSINYNGGNYFFAAFDNIQIDGYLKNTSNVDDFVVYPNPTREEVFIQFSQQPVININYSIIDICGRLVMQGPLNNYRIDLNRLNAGMYFLRLYQNNQLIGKTKKIIKQ